MIAKNIKGKSFGGCVRYVMNETAKLLEAEGVLAENTKSIIQSFAMQRSGRKEVKQPVGHIPLSFAPEDKKRMTDDFMIQLAKEYMQEMGIKNTQYIIVRHHNTDNEHLHIVYNRIDNDLKLISVNHDFKRNIKVCKNLKDKYGLTYGKGKERVKREKLENPDKVKYYIHDAIKSVLPDCKNPAQLWFDLKEIGIEVDYKHKKTSNEIEGVSFRYGDISFKGSQIDRKFSFGNLKKQFEKNVEEAKRQGREAILRQRQQAEQKAKQEAEKQPETKPTSPPQKTLLILGVRVTTEQDEILKNGGSVFLENMNQKDGNGNFSSYVFLNDENDRVFISSKDPETFVEYGKYEMRLRDKILIDKGYITQAKVKWYGIGNYAYPYLWKDNKSETEYQESWGDPRLPKIEKSEKLGVLPKNHRKSKRNKI